VRRSSGFGWRGGRGRRTTICFGNSITYGDLRSGVLSARNGKLRLLSDAFELTERRRVNTIRYAQSLSRMRRLLPAIRPYQVRYAPCSSGYVLRDVRLLQDVPLKIPAMASYDYRCRSCDSTFEVRRPITATADERDLTCPTGHRDVVRVWSAVNLGSTAGSTGSTPASTGGGCCGGGCCA
jgi:putative FmdB family regulatory protein